MIKHLVRTLPLLVFAVTLDGCSQTPSCDNKAAIKVLADQGYANLSAIGTLAVDDKAQNVSCIAHTSGYPPMIYYKVLRSPNGSISVMYPRW
jgi:hypothetical protein